MQTNSGFNRILFHAAQHYRRCQKLKGCFAYHGTTGNSIAKYQSLWFMAYIWRK
jgi:hypothetical protein